MGDPRNWSDRKAGDVKRSNAARDRATLAEVLIYAWGPTNFLGLHPCATQRMGVVPKATCYGCGRVQEIGYGRLVEGPYAHRPWAELMGTFVCDVCTSRPAEISFYTRSPGGTATGYIGKISIHPPPETNQPPPGTSLAHDPMG